MDAPQIVVRGRRLESGVTIQFFHVNLRLMKLLFKWLLSAAALLCVAYLYSGVVVSSFGAAMLAAFVIGLFNMVLRPVLVVLTLPVTVVTLGLFLFVINALMFWAAASVLDGFHVRDFSAATPLL